MFTTILIEYHWFLVNLTYGALALRGDIYLGIYETITPFLVMEYSPPIVEVPACVFY